MLSRALAFLLVSLPATSTAQAPPEIAAGFTCTTNDVASVPAPRASSIARQACEALRRASGGRGYFSVSGEPDGDRYLLTLARVGTELAMTGAIDKRVDDTVRFDRLAMALVGQSQPGASAGSTRPETRAPETLRLSPARTRLFAVEAIAMTPGFLPLSGDGIALGASAAYRSASPRFAFGGELAFAGREGERAGERRKLWYGTIAAGARGFLTADEISPFLGAGLGLLVFGRSADPNTPAAAHSASPSVSSVRRWGVTAGPAPFVEAGLVAARHASLQLVVAARVDLPVLPYDEQASDANATPRDLDPSEKAAQTTSTYVVPVSLRAGVQF